MFWRVRIQLTAWYVAALFVTLLAIGLSAYFVTRRELDRDIHRSVGSALAQLAAGGVHDGALAFGGTPHPPELDLATEEHERMERELAAEFALPPDLFFVVSNQEGAITSNPREVDVAGFDIASLTRGAQGRTRWTDARAGGERVRIATRYVPGEAGEPGLFLHVGTTLTSRDHALEALLRTLAAGGLAAVVLAAVLGSWLAGRALVPVSRSFETQRRFISDASHELRTPIAAIKANNELLGRHPERTVEEVLENVEAIGAESDHMARLVADLLTLARADEGRLEISRERTRLDEIVRDVVRDLEALAELREIAVAVELSPVEVDGDPQRLRQLTVILLDNALKYTPASGSVVVRCGRAGRRAELSVSDTGRGIPAEHLARVFDRFHRVDSSRARRDGGSGLGLAIARWVAEVHGGRISVESAPGAGSTFTVRLPLGGTNGA